ncbi:hypothetical protein AAFN88_09795 [Pelagibius sp. CAU 1746]|uniref:hypothetical protein n=1 Tax=Pelagibius sp. CAU 1746 TaxID=3140370 RepID=UPI00325B2438
MISYALKLARGEFDQVMMELLVNEGFSWDVISEIWEGKVEPYTQSLDCGVEGENIAFVMKSERREQWAAVHKSSDGEEYVAWARTEILARRLAALKGIIAEAEKRIADSEASDGSDDEDAEETPADPEHLRMVSAAGTARDAENWTVLF